jgi:PKD repeat protein
MQIENSAQRGDRWWGSALITLGVVLFVVIAVLAFFMIRDPGGYYDDWVPDDGIEGPEASYEWVSAGLEVTFTDTSEMGDAPIGRWQWDFGDGDVSSEPNPTHRFTEAREWDVTLDVVDDDGRSSKAEGTVEVEAAGDGAGDASIGLADMADKVVESVDRASKGGLVVVLVIGLLIVLTLIGGRLVRYGVRLLRPDPDKIKVKLRPKELELAVADEVEHGHTHVEAIESSQPTDATLAGEERQDAPVGV